MKDRNQRKRTLTCRVKKVSCEIANTCFEVLRNAVFPNGKKILALDLCDNATTWNKVTQEQVWQSTIMNPCVKLRQNYLTWAISKSKYAQTSNLGGSTQTFFSFPISTMPCLHNGKG